MTAAFTAFADQLLAEHYVENPELASSLGLSAFDERSIDLSAAAEERRSAWRTTTLAGLRAFGDDGLSPDERIDRDFLIAILRGAQILEPHQMWKRQPGDYLGPGLNGIFGLFLNRLRPESDLVDAAVARLEGIGHHLEAGMSNLDWSMVPPIYVERAIGQAKAAERYVRTLVPNEAQEGRGRQRLLAGGAKAGDAIAAFGLFLTANRSRASGAYAIGEFAYSALLREKELLPFGARELRERGREQYDLLVAEANVVATEIDGSGDWAALCEKLNRVHAADPEGMRREYEDWTERARQFLKDRNLVTFPAGENCLVEPSPHFQRPILAVASYSRPPAFSDSMTGHFFVPFPPDGEAASEIEKRLEGNSSANIPTTAVHEAYPGHHWHLVTAKANPSRVRRTFSTPYFHEGWALYAERMMREQGFFTDPKHLLYQYEATIFRAARIVVDTSLHLNEMTFDEAVTFMHEKANLPAPIARGEVGRYCAWPTQASSYLTGMLEIVDIRTRWLARKGRSDTAALREFHDALCGSGGLPTTLAERAITGG